MGRGRSRGLERGRGRHVPGRARGRGDCVGGVVGAAFELHLIDPTCLLQTLGALFRNESPDPSAPNCRLQGTKAIVKFRPLQFKSRVGKKLRPVALSAPDVDAASSAHDVVVQRKVGHGANSGHPVTRDLHIDSPPANKTKKCSG